MRAFVPTLVAFALVSYACGLPVGKGTGIDILNGDLKTWRKDYAIAGQTISVGFGYKKGGTIGANAGIVAKINGQATPIGAAITTNINSLKTFEYQIGARILKKITGILTGNTDGGLKYLINLWPIKVSNEGDGITIGLGVQGDKLKPQILGANVGYGGEIANVQVGLDNDMKPESVNVALAGYPNGPSK